jgi:hypothetical protein
MVMIMALSAMHCTKMPWLMKKKLPGQGVRVLRQVRGSHLSLSEPVMKLINDHNALSALGLDQLTELRADFRKHSVLLVAVGQRPTSGYWIHIQGVQVRGEDLYFQGIANKPGESDMVIQALTYPYTAVLLTKVRALHLHPEIESVNGADQP